MEINGVPIFFSLTLLSRMSVKLKLKEFDIHSIASNKVVVMIGKRNTGKSFLIRDLIHRHRDIPFGTVISGTEGANSFYANMVPRAFIHEDFSPELLQNVMSRQKKLIAACKPNTDCRAFLIMDDLMFDSKAWIKDRNVKAMFFNGRHYGMLFVCTMQFPLGIPPELRTNIDYVFILREQFISNRKRLYDHYAGMFHNFEVFAQVLDQCTENYECLVIDNTTRSNKIEDQCFWYKAREHPPFRIAAPQKIWQMPPPQPASASSESSSSSIGQSRFKTRIDLRKIVNDSHSSRRDGQSGGGSGSALPGGQNKRSSSSAAADDDHDVWQY